MNTGDVFRVRVLVYSSIVSNGCGRRKREAGGGKDYTEREYTACISVGIRALPKANLEAMKGVEMRSEWNIKSLGTGTVCERENRAWGGFGTTCMHRDAMNAFNG